MYLCMYVWMDVCSIGEVHKGKRIHPHILCLSFVIGGSMIRFAKRQHGAVTLNHQLYKVVTFTRPPAQQSPPPQPHLTPTIHHQTLQALPPPSQTMSEDAPPLPTNAEDLKRHKALSAMESTSTVADTDSAATTAADVSALGEALGSISSAVKPEAAGAGKPAASAAVKVRAEDVLLVVSLPGGWDGGEWEGGFGAEWTG